MAIASVCVPNVCGATLEEALNDLTRRVRLVIPRGEAVTVDVLAEGDAGERERVRGHFRRVFAAGVAGQGGGVAVTVRLSANRMTKLLVAEVRGSDREVMMAPYEAESRAMPGAVRLTQRLLAEGEGRLLTAAESVAGLVLLFADRIELAGSTVALPEGVAMRDPRGVLRVEGSELRVWAGDQRCGGTLEPLSIACAAGDARWPLGGGEEAALVPGRNFFRHAAGEVFWAERVEAGVIASHLDGALRLHSTGAPAVLERNAGSEFSVAAEGCSGGGSVVLLSAGDGAGVQPFRLRGAKWEAGATVRLSGTVTGLAGSLAVTRSDGERYAVYQLGVRCDE